MKVNFIAIQAISLGVFPFVRIAQQGKGAAPLCQAALIVMTRKKIALVVE